MKFDRIQELMRYITPGLFLIALMLFVFSDEFLAVVGYLEKFSAIIVVLLPFMGFVVGYLIECIMTWIERGLYWLGIARPSKHILFKARRLYVLEDKARAEIRKLREGDDNRAANYLQQIAKQSIGDKEVVSRHYYLSIMSRHIWGAFLIAGVSYLFSTEFLWLKLFVFVLIMLVLGFFWYHQTCVYMKYLFAEYGKALLDNKSV